MKRTASAGQDLARELLAQESSTSEPAETRAEVALRVFEKLRVTLSRNIGVLGFQVLFARAWGLTHAEGHGLKSVPFKAESIFEGFAESMRQQGAEAAAEGSAELLGQLLGLLMTFIGEDLTLHIVRGAFEADTCTR